MAEARPSTDEETAPLLQDPDHARTESETTRHDSSPFQNFLEHVTSITKEPLNALSKVLLVLAIVLLLLTSIFIGLFAGAQHKLKERSGKVPPTETVTTTVVSTATTTQVGTPTAPLPVPTRPPPVNICTTADCVKLSASILGKLDESQDPCENFYEFANGGWLESHEIPAGRGTFGSFESLAQENKRIVRKLIEPASESTAAPSQAPSYDDQTLKKLRGLYTSCLNEEHLDDRGHEPLFEVVKIVRTLFSGNSTNTTAEWTVPLTGAVAYLHSRGIGGLFNFEIDGDVGVDPNAMSLWFFQPDLGLPAKEYYKEKDIRDIYEDTLACILIALSDETEQKSQVLNMQTQTTETANVWPPWPWPPWGDDDDDDDDGKKGEKKKNSTERARDLARDVVEFEHKLAEASLDLEDLYQDPIGTYNPTPFSEFAASLPQLDFPLYLSSFAPRNFPTTVILTSTTYAHSLSAILSSTQSKVVEAYLVTRAALAIAPMLGMKTEVWQAHRALIETLQGIKKGQVPDRADWCVQQVENAMGFAVGRFFVQETFGGESRRKGTKVITDIIDAFKESLKHLEWMDEKSGKAAAEKADAIRVKVGFPLSPDTTSARSIAVYYNAVHIHNNTFAENVLSASTSDQIKKWQQLGKRRNPESWEMYPSMVNAYFNPPANEIVFPAGILRPPFFSQDWPMYLAYGSFGHVAAHELTHAFDSAGRLYNQEGKLEQWWTNATSEGFKTRQDCIAKQYSNYTIDDGKGGKVHVNGNLTSGENIGDTGLIQAYRAWKSQFSASLNDGGEYLLPGLDYTQEQLFFIAFGQIWAQKIKPQAALQRVRTDPHSPNKYRVEGTVFNIPEFAKAFNCPNNAKLNPPPEKQCILW
ncbi:endothelin-converting enzyme 1 [Rickenella mellea]|uniref:Endothelin-converting enzyme 1 n=1 Tax=Rickenella mellea TaxID=50990 RepID=A0A4Y7QAQ3_9AGAM|nr:endothelin-converting enzyme 1 [Rickenella mellea]